MRQSRIINLRNLLTSAKMESIGDNSMSDRAYIRHDVWGIGEQSPAIREKLHHFFLTLSMACSILYPVR